MRLVNSLGKLAGLSLVIYCPAVRVSGGTSEISFGKIQVAIGISER